jgi:hypothetical protein
MTLLAVGACGAQPAQTVGPTAVSATPSPVGSPSASAAPSPAGSPASAPAALDVECTATGTTVATARVAAQPDGVHFRVRNTSGGSPAFEIDGIGGDNTPASEGTLVWPLPTGTARIWCGPSDPTAADWVAVTVVDPAGVFVPDKVACASVADANVDYAQGAKGEHGDPIAIARRHIEGLEPGDTVERAGYPATAEREVRVVRNGTIAAVGTYLSDEQGGWLLSSTATCAGTGIRWGA